MENKKDGTIVCLGCNANYKREVINGVEPQMIDLPTAFPQSKTSSERTEDSHLDQTKSSQNNTARLQTKNNNIPPSTYPQRSPSEKRVRNKKHRFLESDSSEDEFNDESDGEDQAAVLARIREQTKRTNEVSKKIGDKLLAGWTLLEQSCPSCQTPLMRDVGKDKDMLCLSCNTPVISRKDFDPSKHIESSSLKKNSATSSESRPEPIPKEIQKPFATPQPTRPQVDDLIRASPLSSQQSSEPRTAASFTFHYDSPSLSSKNNNQTKHSQTGIDATSSSSYDYWTQETTEHQEIWERTQHTLYTKMNELQRMLAALQDPRAYKDVLVAISKCAEAIAALNAISD